MTRKRFLFVVDVDTEGNCLLDQYEAALWLDSYLSESKLHPDVTCYESMDEMIADQRDRCGAFKD
jgi:hypothetical protein